ncbi:MAG: NAD-binding protein [Chloroflexi bacterium]|nr:NAD-binding protein [Chloroflexota bacterium]
MKVVIMGCGRVGGKLAGLLDIERHNVTILDIDDYSFRRLPPEFGGTALVGNGTDEDALKKAGIEKADAFIALTQGDTFSPTTIFAQMLKERLLKAKLEGKKKAK